MSDYEYTMNDHKQDDSLDEAMDWILNEPRYAEEFERRQLCAKPYLRIEVTHRYVTFIRKHTSTSYEPSRASYDMLVRLANSGEYVVEILDGGYGVAWQMRRKEMER